MVQNLLKLLRFLFKFQLFEIFNQKEMKRTSTVLFMVAILLGACQNKKTKACIFDTNRQGLYP